MAFRKQCDYSKCGAVLGGKEPFLQLHGSVSEQIEEGEKVSFRYLTPHARAKLAWCNKGCLGDWITERGDSENFVTRDIHMGGIY